MKCNHYGWYCSSVETWELCSSVETWELPGLGTYQTLCTVCMLSGPVTDNRVESITAFWKINNERDKEIMSTEDYKRGVEDATDTKLWVGAGLKPGGEPVAEKLAEIRKKLLTKKVTKYVNIYKKGDVLTAAPYLVENPYCANHPYRSIEADIEGKPVGVLFGSYPVELELPL